MIPKGNKAHTKKARLSHTQIVFLSFVTVILIGTFLLMLPISQNANEIRVGFTDCLFTATSATCVTGLVTVTTATQWTLFGQIVILCLIQIGGLSFIAFYSFFMIYLGKKITMGDRLLIQTTFNQTSIQGMAKMVLLIVRGTVIVESSAALILFLYFKTKEQLPIGRALYWGIFHAISGFCNAGFDVIGENNLAPYVDSLVVNLVIMSLIIVGGIGFFVWREVIEFFKYLLHNKTIGKKFRFSVHSKFALITTGCLLLSGALFFFFLEGSNPGTMENMSMSERILASMFQSTTLRTAGFSTIPQGELKESSKFVSSLFMMIGGSPGGTAGGIKTVTIALLFTSVWSTIRGRNGIIVYDRKIPTRLLQKALTITVVMGVLLLIVTGVLSVIESHSPFPHTFLDIFYEVASALGTVGLTTGITPYLTVLGKIVLILCMLTGRLGPLTVFYTLRRSMEKNQDNINFPEEGVLIG